MWQCVTHGRCTVSLVLSAALWAAIFGGEVRRSWAAEPEFIDGAEAVRILNAEPGQNVVVVLEDMNGEEIVMHARVAPSSSAFKKVTLDPVFTHRPGSDKLLMVEYFEKKLGRPLTDSPEDRQLIKTRPRLVRSFEVDGRLVRDYQDRFKVKSIEPLNMSGPKLPVAMTLKAVKLPDDDPWIGTRKDDPSNWAVDYTIKGEPKPFRYQIPFYETPDYAPITTVTVEEPTWMWSSRFREHMRAVCFRVRQGANAPILGGFYLDDWGYPIYSWYSSWSPILDKDLVGRLTPWYRWSLQVKSHEFKSYAEAQEAQPSLFGKQKEVAQILHDLLASTRDPHVQYLTLCTLGQLTAIREDTIPFVKQILDSDSDKLVQTARGLLDAHEEYLREQSQKRRY